VAGSSPRPRTQLSRADRPQPAANDRPRAKSGTGYANNSKWVAELNEQMLPFRLLTGIRSGHLGGMASLDQEEDSWPRSTWWWPACTPSSGMDLGAMTTRMAAAIESPHTDILRALHWSDHRGAKGRPPIAFWTPERSSMPAPEPAPRSRSTPDPERRDPPAETASGPPSKRGANHDRHRTAHGPGPSSEWLGNGVQPGDGGRCSHRTHHQHERTRRAWCLGRPAMPLSGRYTRSPTLGTMALFPSIRWHSPSGPLASRSE